MSSDAWQQPTNSGLTVTLKAGVGFDSPWIVVHADTVDEARNMLKEIRDTNLMMDTAATAKALQAEYGPSAAPQRGGGYAPRPAANSGGATVKVRVPFDKADLRQQVKDAGGRWDAQSKTWNVPQDNAEPFRKYFA